MTAQPQRDIPKRRKRADHFGYGNQVALGKHKDGNGLWHSHGMYYHKPDTFWCGNWGDRTPEELIRECETTLEDLKTYFPELFSSRPHTSTPNPCEEQGCTDIENCYEICEHSRIYSPAWVKQHDTAIRNATINEFYKRIKAERDPSLEYVDWDSIEAVFIRLRDDVK